MTDQAKKGGKPAAAPDKGKVSDADLEKVSGGTGSAVNSPNTAVIGGSNVQPRDGDPMRAPDGIA